MMTRSAPLAAHHRQRLVDALGVGDAGAAVDGDLGGCESALMAPTMRSRMTDSYGRP